MAHLLPLFPKPNLPNVDVHFSKCVVPSLMGCATSLEGVSSNDVRQVLVLNPLKSHGQVLGKRKTRQICGSNLKKKQLKSTQNDSPHSKAMNSFHLRWTFQAEPPDLDLVIGLTDKTHDGNPQAFAQNHRLGRSGCA